MKPDDPNKNQGISEDDKTLNDKINHVEKWRLNTMILYSFEVCKVKNKQNMLPKNNDNIIFIPYFICITYYQNSTKLWEHMKKVLTYIHIHTHNFNILL